jgi:hypothetical protein
MPTQSYQSGCRRQPLNTAPDCLPTTPAANSETVTSLRRRLVGSSQGEIVPTVSDFIIRRSFHPQRKGPKGYFCRLTWCGLYALTAFSPVTAAMHASLPLRDNLYRLAMSAALPLLSQERPNRCVALSDTLGQNRTLISSARSNGANISGT